MKSRCGNCGVEGTVHGVPPGVVPELIVCGNCGAVSTYRATRYELIGQDYEGDLTTPFYLSPAYRTTSAIRCPKCNKRHHNGKPINGEDAYRCLGCGQAWNQTAAAPDHRLEWLKKAATRQVLALLNTVRAYGNWPDDFYSFTVEELKAELATREHVPNKKEAEVLRRRRAQGKSV